MKIKISKIQWQEMGKKAGWLKAQNTQQIVFDVNARIKIFIEPWELESEDGYDEIVKDKNISNDEKVKRLRDLSLTLADYKTRNMVGLEGGGNNIQISDTDLSLGSIASDTIRWEDIVNPEPEDVTSPEFPVENETPLGLELDGYNQGEV